LGIGIPIPILDEQMAAACAVTNDKISTAVFDYSEQKRSRTVLREVTYSELRSGEIDVKGKKVPTSSLSSLHKARQVAEMLKNQIKKGEFMIEKPVQSFSLDRVFRPLDVRSEREAV
ncbi:MAG TPA: homocysteine biosynthesis protein, partial [Thermoplasmata archaeon]